MSIWRKLPNSNLVRKELQRLSPMEDVDRGLEKYYQKKLRKLAYILLLGVLFCLLAKWKGEMEGRIDAQGVVQRGDIGGAEERLRVQVSDSWGEEEELTVSLRPREYSEEEIQSLYEIFLPKLEEIVLNGNESKDYVRSTLSLVEEVEGFPFLVNWRSGDYTVIHWDGRVTYDETKGKQLVRLTATITYKEYSYEHWMDLCVVEPYEDEHSLWIKSLEEAWMEAENNTEEGEIQLPNAVQGVTVQWKEKNEFSLGLWILVVVLLAILLFFLEDLDLHKKSEERQESLKDAYPMLLHRLLLYLGAGLPVRASFERVAKEYQGTSIHSPIKEELLWSLGELQAGISEAAVYENLGKRSGVKEYARLGTLLNQNLKRGNATILERLKEENGKATTELLNKRKKESEEAQTIFLIPMVMMLAIVLVLIIVPAFMGMGWNG